MKCIRTPVLLVTLTALLLRAGHALGLRVRLVLASALRKIESRFQRLPMRSGSPTTAHLFRKNPFAEGGLLRLFSTNLPIEARLERLETKAVHGCAAPVREFG